MNYFCKRCKQDKTVKEMDIGRHGKPSNSTCKKCRHKRQHISKKNHPKTHMLQWARRRAKVYNLPYNVTPNDFEIPVNCPVLGIKLQAGVGKFHDASPSLERIVPELGYVKGNIHIISYKANRMKNNATLEELEKLVAWLKSKET